MLVYNLTLQTILRSTDYACIACDARCQDPAWNLMQLMQAYLQDVSKQPNLLISYFYFFNFEV